MPDVSQLSAMQFGQKSAATTGDIAGALANKVLNAQKAEGQAVLKLMSQSVQQAENTAKTAQSYDPTKGQAIDTYA